MSKVLVDQIEKRTGGTAMDVPAGGKWTAANIANATITATQVANDTITATQIAANAIGNSEMADDAVGIAELSATGTASATTFLRGDNAWVALAGAASELKGWRIRPIFHKNANTTVKLCGPFAYQHDGTTAQILTGADVTFTRSDTSNTAQFNYLYIDDSAVVTAGNTTITASELISSPTAPTLNATKGGFYNGNDRCIFAWRQAADNDIYNFMPVSPYAGNPGVVVTDGAWQFVNQSGNWGTGWKEYTTGTDYLPRPCGPSGIGIGMYLDLGGSHADMRVGMMGYHYDAFIVNSPWQVVAPVDDTGKFSVRLNYAHSSYTQIFYTRGWVMSPLL